MKHLIITLALLAGCMNEPSAVAPEPPQAAYPVKDSLALFTEPNYTAALEGEWRVEYSSGRKTKEYVAHNAYEDHIFTWGGYAAVTKFSGTRFWLHARSLNSENETRMYGEMNATQDTVFVWAIYGTDYLATGAMEYSPMHRRRLVK